MCFVRSGLERLFLGLTCISTLACGGDTFEPPPEVKAAAGTYTLISVNGSPPPVGFGVSNASCARFMDGGSMVLLDGGGYTLSLPVHAVCPLPAGGTNTVSGETSEGGGWTISGSQLTLNPSGTRISGTTVTLTGNTIQMDVQFEWAGQSPRMTLVLRK